MKDMKLFVTLTAKSKGESDGDSIYFLTYRAGGSTPPFLEKYVMIS